jgi:hypothetical protein
LDVEQQRQRGQKDTGPDRRVDDVVGHEPQLQGGRRGGRHEERLERAHQLLLARRRHDPSEPDLHEGGEYEPDRDELQVARAVAAEGRKTRRVDETADEVEDQDL